ncbi:Flp family type IVb pilin [Vibrio splendidus]|uniref:Flp family type IVb pilin n=1 Tax=Vibrio splendidus TaxID=29497 RepID=UPI002468E68C|nr:Flp family type IVb pilin [Vibrio splendidus]MDH5903631.1 Flp family type IVb pilin [Vibrio splendidus]
MITKLYVKTSMFLSQFKNDERGVTAIEYGLIAVAMAVLVTTAVGTDGFIGKLGAAFEQVATAIGTASGTASGG